MKRLFFYFVVAVFFVGCQTNQNNDATSDNAASGITINYETDNGIPEFSAVTNDAVTLRYKFTKGEKAHVVMDYSMIMEMMGQRMPMQMKMESDYEINDVAENGNAEISVQFTRIQMEMDGPQVVKFDSDEVEDLASDPLGASFAPVLANPIGSVISPLGTVVEMDMESMIDGMSEEAAAATRVQIENMSNQFSQNMFVALPEHAVKIGDTYKAGVVETDAGGMKINMDMQYKILSISECKRYIVVQPDGEFSFQSEMPGMEMNTDNNKIAGWLLFDLERGLPLRSNMIMNMDILANQMGQEIEMKIEMDIKMSIQ